MAVQTPTAATMPQLEHKYKLITFTFTCVNEPPFALKHRCHRAGRNGRRLGWACDIDAWMAFTFIINNNTSSRPLHHMHARYGGGSLGTSYRHLVASTVGAVAKE